MRNAGGSLLRRRARFAVFLATALSFFLAQLQVDVHEMVVAHVACAEHGQVEDVQQVAGDAAEHRHTVPVIEAGPATSDHKPCALPPGLTSGMTALSAPTVLHPALISFLDPQQPEGVPGRTGPPLLSVAPKLSPPRA